MSHFYCIPAFLANLRGWQLVIVLGALLLLILIPGLLGFRLGRMSSRKNAKTQKK